MEPETADGIEPEREAQDGEGHSRDPAPSVEGKASPGALREAARHAIEMSSLRATAREIGMSAPGLKHFVGGGTPFERTTRKLRIWHERGLGGAASPELADEILDLLLGSLPADERRKAKPLAAARLATVFDHARSPRPPWVAALLEDADGDDRPGGAPLPAAPGDHGRRVAA